MINQVNILCLIFPSFRCFITFCQIVDLATTEPPFSWDSSASIMLIDAVSASSVLALLADRVEMVINSRVKFQMAFMHQWHSQQPPTTIDIIGGNGSWLVHLLCNDSCHVHYVVFIASRQPQSKCEDKSDFNSTFLLSPATPIGNIQKGHKSNFNNTTLSLIWQNGAEEESAIRFTTERWQMEHHSMGGHFKMCVRFFGSALITDNCI